MVLQLEPSSRECLLRSEMDRHCWLRRNSPHNVNPPCTLSFFFLSLYPILFLSLKSQQKKPNILVVPTITALFHQDGSQVLSFVWKKFVMDA